MITTNQLKRWGTGRGRGKEAGIGEGRGRQAKGRRIVGKYFTLVSDY